MVLACSGNLSDLMTVVVSLVIGVGIILAVPFIGHFWDRFGG